MPDRPHHIPVPREVPLCLEHFFVFAKNYHAEYGSTTVKLKETSQITLKNNQDAPIRSKMDPPEPTRVQPRRAAKQKYVESKIAEQKKKKSKVTGDTNKQMREQLRVSSDDSQSAKKSPILWSDMEPQLRTLVYRAVHRNAITGTCPFGTEPWTCQECALGRAREIRALREADWFDEGEGVPAIADMEPIGEIIRVSSPKLMPILEDDKLHWAGLTFVVDSCVIPMFWILKAD